jgi:hypothetical protein
VNWLSGLPMLIGKSKGQGFCNFDSCFVPNKKAA